MMRTMLGFDPFSFWAAAEEGTRKVAAIARSAHGAMAEFFMVHFLSDTRRTLTCYEAARCRHSRRRALFQWAATRGMKSVSNGVDVPESIPWGLRDRVRH